MRAQLKLVATSHERLEAALRSAEGMAYQQSAEPTTPPVTQALIAQNTLGPRWLSLLAAGAIAMAGLAFGIAYLRRRSTPRG